MVELLRRLENEIEARVGPQVDRQGSAPVGGPTVLKDGDVAPAAQPKKTAAKKMSAKKTTAKKTTKKSSSTKK
jgi:topoisomerase IA-like protein